MKKEFLQNIILNSLAILNETNFFVKLIQLEEQSYKWNQQCLQRDSPNILFGNHMKKVKLFKDFLFTPPVLLYMNLIVFSLKYALLIFVHKC